MIDSRKLKKSLGFTLIEVMLAMAVFSFAGIALLTTATNNSRNIAYLEDKMFANWVASNQLVSVHLGESWPPKNNLRAIVMEIRLAKDDELPISSLTTYVSKVEK